MHTLKEKAFCLLQHCLPQKALSRLAGALANNQTPWLKNWLIRRFIAYFSVDMSEAVHSNYRQYKNFNEFFTRPLVDGARPLQGTEATVVSPADGAISEIGEIHHDRLLQAKGRDYSLQQLLADGDATSEEQLSDLFIGGNFATIYLSPKDYHRVHMPLGGRLRQTRYIPGQLFSVNQGTANHIDGLFARNERLVSIFDSDAGPMAVIMVGAMIVASIETQWCRHYPPHPNRVLQSTFNDSNELRRGQEMGRFNLGSTAILLFAKDTVKWCDRLTAGSVLRQGEALMSVR